MIDADRSAPNSADDRTPAVSEGGPTPRPDGGPDRGASAGRPGGAGGHSSPGVDDQDQADRGRRNPEEIDDPSAAQEEAARQREEEGGYQ